MSKRILEITNQGLHIEGTSLTVEQRAEILRQTRGSISAETAKKMLAHVAKGRREWEERLKEQERIWRQPRRRKV